MKQFLAIITSNDDVGKAQKVQTDKKNCADLDRKEVGEMMSFLTVELTRKELYEEIRTPSVAGVARK